MPIRLMLVCLMALTSPALAHDWYPMECCNAQDCSPVDKVEMVPPPKVSMFGTSAHANNLGGMLVTSRHGTVFVPADFPRRESKDNRMHVCMWPPMNVSGIPKRLICIFLPPPS